MNYIKDALDININIKPWNKAGSLPYYLIDKYNFSKVVLDDVPCLFIEPKGELDNLSAIKKHIIKINEFEKAHVVLDIKYIDSWRKKSLIRARIPFYVDKCQIYLPFMGIVLNERYNSNKPNIEFLMPASQLLLFYYLYQKDKELYTGNLNEKFGFTSMQISRAVTQLKSIGFISTYKDGVRIILTSEYEKKELFDLYKQYLINPVRKKLYVDFNKIINKLPVSGITALSQKTMLGAPRIKTLAYFGKIGDLSGTNSLVDYDSQVEVEIWKYNPTLLSESSDITDTLSLAVSLQSDEDPRVEQAVEEMLDELWEKINDQRIFL